MKAALNDGPPGFRPTLQDVVQKSAAGKVHTSSGRHPTIALFRRSAPQHFGDDEDEKRTTEAASE
jgi:hypothetical protein